MAVPSNVDVGHWLTASSGHEVKVIDLLRATSFPWGTVLVCLSAVLVIAVVLHLLRGRNRSVDDADQHEMHSDIGYGAQCPNCRSYATRERDSFEKRSCELCGHNFTLH